MAVTYTSNEWARIANTTTAEFLKGQENAVMRKRPVFAMMKKRGQVKMNCSDDGVKWAVKYKRVPMSVNNGEQPIDFVRTNRWVNAYLDYEGYAVGDQVTKREKLKNRGNGALVKFFNKIAAMLTEDIQDQFTEELYVNDSASGNTGRFSGLESMFAATQTITVSSGAARTANAADPCGYPADTYAELQTELGAEGGGSWGTQTDINSTWPFGRGSTSHDSFDFWTPVIVNYTSTAFDGSSSTWQANAVRAVRFALDAVNTRNKLADGDLDLVLLDRGLYRQYKDTLDSKERINVTASNELRALGFEGTDMISQDGATIMSEFGIPAGVGYGLSMKCIELRSMQDQIFVPEGPDYDISNRAWRYVVDIIGQFKFKSPRNFFKLVALA